MTRAAALGASEQALFEREMQTLYAKEKCSDCQKRPFCFKRCCFPPRDWYQVIYGLDLCHQCLHARDPYREPHHAHTYNRCKCGHQQGQEPWE